MPDMSVRVDPFNWLVQGRLGFELEVGVWEFLSFELVPVFVVNEQPPSLNLRGVEDTVTQHSNGIGAMSGASFGLGFWLSGEPFEGNVLRLVLTNYGYTFRGGTNSAGEQDEVSHTERVLMGMFGTHYKWEFFTLAFAFGLGWELNQETRCVRSDEQILTGDDCPDKGLHIDYIDGREVGQASLDGPLSPAVLAMRLSLGFVF